MGTTSLSDLRRADGGSYVLAPAPAPVCGPGEFAIAACGFEHGHIYGEIGSLCQAGATLKWVWDRNPEQLAQVAGKYPQARVARSLDEVLSDPEVRLVCAADVPALRAELGIACMRAGKDYLTDKTPFTSLEQLSDIRLAIAETGRKYMCYYSERLCVECAMLAGDLIEQGAIGRVLHVIGLGPHRLGDPAKRPGWFYRKRLYGGILCDIGSHQCEQYLHYSGATDATIATARVANFNHPQFPELEDFGEASLVGDNGTSFYFRVDWFTPDGLSNWGDGRTLILGTEGTIELRKFVDLATGRGGNQLYLFDQRQELHLDAKGTVGTRFFNQLIRDCLDRTETAMTQEHALKAGELCVKLQMAADANR